MNQKLAKDQYKECTDRTRSIRGNPWGLVKLDRNLVLSTKGKNEFIPDIKHSSH